MYEGQNSEYIALSPGRSQGSQNRYSMNLKINFTKFFPFLRWGRNMTQDSVRADAMAGLTGAAIVLPQGVAFAAIAGMPPEYGLYTSMVPAVIAALFGSSWHLVSGPTTAASVIMFGSLSAMAVPGSEKYVALAITLAFMVGVLQLIMGVVRLGALVNFISHSVVVGFTAGAACLIAAKQSEEFLGIEVPDNWSPIQVGDRKLADPVSEEWIKQYLQDLRQEAHENGKVLGEGMRNLFAELEG